MKYKTTIIQDPKRMAEQLAQWLDQPELDDMDQPDREWYQDQDDEWKCEKYMHGGGI